VLPSEVSVFIAGGGPFGLMLANELGRRGVSVLLVDSKEGTTRNVQANATQARTMEHYRRLGFAEEVRALGMPADFPTDIAYFTRFARHELARFSLPSARDARQLVRALSGSWSAAELPHRCNQKFIEPVLRRHAERLPGVSVRYGWRMTRFQALEDDVRAQVEPAPGRPSRTVRAGYLVGGDGPRSRARRSSPAGDCGPATVAGACTLSIAASPPSESPCARLDEREFQPRAPLSCRQSMAGTSSPFTQLKPNEDEARVTDESAAEMCGRRRRALAVRSWRDTGRRAIRWWPSASAPAACSSAETRRTFSRRPAAWATTPRSRTR
jgi:2-polyprenyl-6-methoxyphenol hydroxylase-like FAD-dependent oxidoreductase